MALRLDPGIPIVWRTTTSLQVGGLSPIALFPEVTHDEEVLLAALRLGITRTGLDAVAEVRRMPTGTVEGMLHRLGPALEPARAPVRRALIVGEGAFADRLDELMPGAPASRRPSLAVLVAPWLVTPAVAGAWLRRDVRHLPVVLGERSVAVGPLVDPGSGPCLHCVERHRLDEDPTRPAVAAQLLGLPEPRLEPLATAHALSWVGRQVADAVEGRMPCGAERRLDFPEVSVTERLWAPHPECSCAAPPGTGSAPAPVARPSASAPSGGPAGASRA